tara:strand:+ start:6765 stop:10184 length:3420 start_codon:yes stop_codon:yes gene_type:complete
MVCVLFIVTTTITAQSGSEIYRHITSRDGISNTFVWEMMQDRQGFIWIAGNNGLDRYDGYNVTTFRNDPNNETTITAGSVFSLFEDRNGLIWIGTGLGISVFDPKTELFLQVQGPENGPALRSIRGVFQDDDGTMWFGGLRGIYKFQPGYIESESREAHFYGLEEVSDTPQLVQTIEKGMDGQLWVGTEQGIHRFDPESEEFTKIESFSDRLDPVLNSAIWKIFRDSNENVWISSDLGLAVWRSGEDEPELIPELGDGTVDLTGQFMQSITEDIDGYIWLGTGEIGAIKYHPESGVVQRFRHNSNNQNSISEDDVHYVFKDSDDNVWFGYHNVGISVMYTQPWEYSFNQLTDSDDPAHPLNDIHTVQEDEAGNIWMATHGGLIRLPSDGGSMETFLPDPGNTEPDNTENQIAGLLQTGNQVFVWTHALKYHVFNIDQEQFTLIDIPDDTQFSFLNMTTETDFYVGTFGGSEFIKVQKDDLSVSVIEAPRRDPDPSTNRAIMPHVSSQGDINIKFVYLEVQNFYWDYFLYEPEGDIFTKLDMQSPDGVSLFRPSSISNNDEGVLWLITNLGVLREDLINNQSRFLFQSDAGLFSDTVNEILEDENGYLWIGGVSEVIKLDPVTENLTIFEADPLRKPEFFRNSAQLNNGDIIFSGVGGYVRFDPDQQLEDPGIQNIHITELRSGAETFTTLNSDDEYEIDHTNNNLSFSYLALNYRNPSTTRYRYRLTGYNDEWTEVGMQRSVFLANLPPGNYIFQVQAAQRFGSFSNTTAELDIAVLPPWWRTVPAYLFFVLLLAGGVYTVDRVQRRRVIRREREMAREKELAQAKEIEKAYEHLKAAQDQLVQQEKLASLGQLTAGIAHEIKNPLNFVNNFSELSVELIEEARKGLSAVSRQISGNSGKGSTSSDSTAKDNEGAGANTKAGDENHIDETFQILDDIEANLRKIHEHGSRADSIVKSMLQHSRGGTGKMVPTDLNALIKEYVNLAFHGMRASKEPINVDIDLQLDESIGEIPLISEDFSRVILNLCNNAFDACAELSRSAMREGLSAVSDQPSASYEAKLMVRTKAENGNVIVEIEDNGPGIPEEIKDKILQPFFTTKKGTAGTGLGLSITHDIVKAHGGELGITSDPGKTVFTITIAN